MEAKVDHRYEPPESFKPLDKASPLVDEAFSEGKELWLIQFPTNELKPEDLGNKNWNMRLVPKDGFFGQFCNSRGDEILVMNQDCSIDNPRFAFFPTIDGSFSVRQIACQASFTCWPEIESTKSTKETVEQDAITPQKKDLALKISSSKRSNMSTISDRSVENHEESERTHSRNDSIKKPTNDHDMVSGRTDKDGEVTVHAGEQPSEGAHGNNQHTDSKLPMKKPSRVKSMEIPCDLMNGSPSRTPEGEHSQRKKKKHKEHSQSNDVTRSLQMPSRENTRELPSNFLNELPPPHVNQDIEATLHERKGQMLEDTERSHKKKKKHLEHSQSSDVTSPLQKPSKKEVTQTPSKVSDVVISPAANQEDVKGIMNEREESSKRTERSHSKKRKNTA